MTDHAMFVGPSGGGLADALTASGARLLPPARRGSILSLIDEAEQPGTITIVDGVFHDVPAVGHAEIRQALTAGWTVWGLCSMGAIRAAELASAGMRGYGRVYEMFVRHPSTPDDEVTLLHSDEPPWRPLSEPLVHLRSYLAHLVGTGRVTAGAGARIEEDLRQRWFGHRTLDALYELATALGADPDPLRRDLRSFDRWRVKDADLRSYLEDRPWLGAHR